jgi:hypothetical protein
MTADLGDPRNQKTPAAQRSETHPITGIQLSPNCGCDMKHGCNTKLHNEGKFGLGRSGERNAMEEGRIVARVLDCDVNPSLDNMELNDSGQLDPEG